ncbi:glycosyltransferase family 4 protein [Sphingobacterium chuzhouense]|uniref:Glycosyltransferase family 4 protein n=1 Tax=Sphingobacterium chuzhouense TaxID=1742264 RepID=A0ABR7XPN5_9SPHI|nr:glycosyltransferase family 4 protein [Sphingobacterium chuzhouense]MBD1420242.1 glycosyltransferase family 4 protein [Sphingobacterium chuzhouense]
MGLKIAIVVQRYGLEVNGGAEYHARILAEKLSGKYQVEVLTTTALDYYSWDNHYPLGEESINEIKVYRFATIKQKSKKYRTAKRAIFKQKKYFKILKKIGIFDFFDRRFHITEVKHSEIENWLISQGPYCPELVNYIKSNGRQYDTFIFFTYRFYPTVVGMPLVSDKSIFIPTAHDEPLIYTEPYKDIFSVPRFIMYNTESEKRLIENVFKNHTKHSDIAGVGINKYVGEGQALPDSIEAKKYFIYIGRVDKGKGCDQLLEYYIRFQQENPQYKEYKLILVGKNDMTECYEHPSVIYMGFVSEELKYALLRSARATIMPSLYESLSLVTLEGMNEKIPAIVNKKCEVLYEHILKSGTGTSYDSLESFCSALKTYITKSDEELKEEGEKAKIYVAENYTWESVLAKFEKGIDFVTGFIKD